MTILALLSVDALVRAAAIATTLGAFLALAVASRGGR
jgi:hypothetical protein